MYRHWGATALLSPAALVAAPLSAQVDNTPLDDDAPEATSGIEVSGTVSLVSEYRFRGVDLSGGDIAIQGGIDIAHESGFYVGTWGSSLDEDTVGYGHTEIDLFGGWSGDVSEGLAADVGVIAYLYPNAGPGDFDYYEFYGALSGQLGPIEATVGTAYAFEQDSLGGDDNLYVYLDGEVAVPSTPLTLSAHIGYTDGFLTFTNDGDAFDWSIGAEAVLPGTPLSLGVSYVGVEGDIPAGAYPFTDDAIVVSLGASF